MGDHDRALESIRKLQELYSGRGEAFTDTYSLGFRNGIEAALALLEERPPFYLDKNNNYDKLDQEQYPEYFF